MPGVPAKVNSSDSLRSFRPAYRLCKTDEYSSVFAFRKTIKGRFFVLHYRPTEKTSARIGIVVAKKLAKRAVQRNFIKRMGRELFRSLRVNLPCHDLILRLQSSPVKASKAELRHDMQHVFNRLLR